MEKAVTDIEELKDKPVISFLGKKINDYHTGDGEIMGCKYIYFLVKRDLTVPARLAIAMNGTANSFIYKLPVGHPNFPLYIVT